ncbi:MAG: ribosome-associated toxin RatA of RatAB toxin-antitoxin module [Acidimicrobiales bacterium]|jgi:ribosome-associated toxin RatA of RatAB toxin-antitoxin module
MGDRAFERTIIRDTPERIFDVITDYAAYPQWANNVKDVTVDRLDEDGRAGLVSYRAAAMGRSAAYVLEYFYGTNPLRVAWRLAEGDLVRRLDGRYVLVPLEDDVTGPRTEVTYELEVDISMPMSGFLRRRAESRILRNALEDLRSWVEEGAQSST